MQDIVENRQDDVREMGPPVIMGTPQYRPLDEGFVDLDFDSI
jgi:hypothetical protein